MYKCLLFICAFLSLSRIPLFAQENETVKDTVEVGVSTAPKPAEAPAFSVIKQKQLVDVRKLPQEKVEDLKRSDDYWYANAEPEKKEEPKQEEVRRRTLFDEAWF